MSLQSDLIQRLIALNTDAGNRIHDEIVPQSIPFPFVALSEVGGSRPTDISGAGLLKRSTIRIGIFGRTAVERETVTEAIKANLVSIAVRETVGSTVMSSVRVETSSDEVAVADGDNVIKGKGLDVFVVYY